MTTSPMNSGKAVSNRIAQRIILYALAFAALEMSRSARLVYALRFRSELSDLPKSQLFDPKLTDVAAPLVTDDKIVDGSSITPNDPHGEQKAPGMDSGPENEAGQEASGSGSDAGSGSFAFFPATDKERKEAASAPFDPHVAEAMQDNQPWQPYIPHGIDLGASSQLTGDNFMGDIDVTEEEDPFRAFNPHIMGRHTPPPLLGGAPYPRL